MSIGLKRPAASYAERLLAAPPAGQDDLRLESPSTAQRAISRFLNPWRNAIVPASWLRLLLRLSRSPLIAETTARPGGWRAMEIIYRNARPIDWFDRQALRVNPICMAARNRRVVVTRTIARLIANYGATAPVTVLGIGAGPGRHVQTAIVDSQIDKTRVHAYLIDLDDDAFEYGKLLSRQLGIARCMHFLRGDARQIRQTLPDISANIVKVVGLAEYLSDAEFLELLAALREVIAPGGSLLTHGLVDVYGTGRFLARVFNLRHHQRTAPQMIALLESAGFHPVECVVEPTLIHPIITAVRDH